MIIRVRESRSAVCAHLQGKIRTPEKPEGLFDGYITHVRFELRDSGSVVNGAIEEVSGETVIAASFGVTPLRMALTLALLAVAVMVCKVTLFLKLFSDSLDSWWPFGVSLASLIVFVVIVGRRGRVSSQKLRSAFWTSLKEIDENVEIQPAKSD